ncbi:MAG TPA: hypothetical protein VFZ32_00790 [Micromonosporaceae bacterium]
MSYPTGAPPHSPDGNARRWVLVGLAGLAAVIGAQSLFADWLRIRFEMFEVAEEETRHGIGHFGALGVGYGVGIILATALVGLALWQPRRVGTGPPRVVLGLGLLLLVDLGIVTWRFHTTQNETAETVVRLRESTDTIPTLTGFQVTSPGLYAALTATLLLMLVAAELAAPGRSVPVQAVTGAVFAVAAVVAPWARIWVIESGESDVPFELRTLWPWSTGVDGGVLVVELLVLLVIVVGCLRAPGYGRARWAFAATVFAGLSFFGVLAFEVDTKSEAFALRNEVSEVLAVSSTGAGALFAVGAVLLGVAAVRSWWHGREEVYHPISDDGWLPAGLRHKRGQG